MKFSLALPLLALASSALASDAQTVIADVADIEAALSSFNTTLNKYQAKLIPALGLLASGNKVQAAIERTTKDAKASPDFGSDSTQVAVANLNLIQTSYSIFDNLIAHKPVLTKSILLGISAKPFVKGSLTKQKKASTDLGDAIVAKLDEPFKSLAPTYTAQLAARFDDTIAEFS